MSRPGRASMEVRPPRGMITGHPLVLNSNPPELQISFNMAQPVSSSVKLRVLIPKFSRGARYKQEGAVCDTGESPIKGVWRSLGSLPGSHVTTGVRWAMTAQLCYPLCDKL